MSRISVDVYNAAGTRLGSGPVFVSQASVKRMLDGVGNFSFSHPAHDERAAELFAEERRIRINIEQNGVTRELGRGIIRKRDYSAGSGATISVSGPDTLDELKRRNVLLNRAYNNQMVALIVDDLVAIMGPWASTCTVTTLMSGRFDGSSVMKALQDLIKLQGLHFRQTPGANTIEVAAFGDTSPVTLVNTNQVTAGMYSNDNIALIDSIKHSRVSEGVINRLYLLGAGANVDSALTLALSTRTTPYPIQTAVVNGRTLYSIEDTSSIAAYGVIERLVQFKEIAPLSNSPTDVERAANAVYDAGVAMLQRYKDPQESYSVSLKKCTQTIVPGDKVRLVYKDPVMREDGSWAMPRPIDALFWVMSVTESVSANGTISTSLDITSIDRYEDSIAKTILGQLDQVRVQGAMVQPSINHYVYGPEQVQIDATHAAKVQLIVTDATFSIDRVLMRVRTRPFTSTATGAASGGGSSLTSASGGGSVQSSTATSHQHMILRSSDGTAVGTLALRTFTILEQTTNTLFHFQAQADVGASPRFFSNQLDGSHSHDVTIPAHTHDVTIPSHVHAMNYGIYTDTVRPVDISITVNGVSVTPSPIGVSGTDLDTTIDITQEIVNKVGGFQAVHDIVISCASSQGEVVVTLDTYETITPFKLS